MQFGTSTGMPPQPTNNLWFGNNYSSGYSQMSRSNYPTNMIQANPMMQQPMGQPQTINNILQVMGPESADSFKVGPNSHAIFVDSSRPVIYLKHSDDSGFSETKAFQIKEIPLFPETVKTNYTEVESSEKTDLYVTKEEFINWTKAFDEWTKSFDEYKNMIEELVTKNE